MDANQLRTQNQTVPFTDTSSELLSYEINFTNLISHKDRETHQHSNRVATLTKEWILHQQSRQQWLELDLQSLVRAARLHDVGKVGILNQILNKPGPLTSEEKEQLNQHSEIGYELVRDIPSQETIALAIRHHHERWDGLGYPSGLRGNEIPFFAQVISLVDAFDAMTSDRPYQAARSASAAIAEIQANAGRQFSIELAADFVQFLHARNS